LKAESFYFFLALTLSGCATGPEEVHDVVSYEFAPVDKEPYVVEEIHNEPPPKLYDYTDEPRFEEPRPYSRIAPMYPDSLRRFGIKGSVHLYYLLTELGEVTDIVVLFATDRAFVRPTVEAISRWKFEPATVNGKPVPVQLMQKFHFSLN
jgi:protein TonB